MRRPAKRVQAWLEDLFSDEDDPNEPGYDPVHLGTTVLATFCAIGGLYWLLWTLLVYEGGIGLKAAAAAKVLFTPATLADVGWVGYPYEMGAFQGVFGNLGALAAAVGVLWAARRLYRRPWKPARD